MEIAEAKKICRDINLAEKEDGTYGCKHLLAPDMCELPKYFFCLIREHHKKQEALVPVAEELPKKLKKKIKQPVVIDLPTEEEPKQIEKLVPVSALTRYKMPTFSVSRTGTLENCPREYYLHYVLKVRAQYDPAWRKLGIAFSEQRALLDEGKPLTLNDPKYGNIGEPEKAKLRAVLRVYAEKFKPKEKLLTETKVEFEFDGIKYLGYIDGETLDGKQLFEWKYAATKYTPIKVARQASVYMFGRPGADKITLAVAPKTTHKPSAAGKPTKKNPEPQGETIEEFEERVYQILVEENRFEFTDFKRNDLDIETILLRMNASIKLLPAIAEAGFPPHYSIGCEDCEYHDLCNSHLKEDIGCSRGLCPTKSLCSDIKIAKARVGSEGTPR